jgi:hypothetical protein
MPHKPHRETPIERIYREVMGRKMPLAIRRILVKKTQAQADATLNKPAPNPVRKAKQKPTCPRPLTYRSPY